MGIDGEEVKGNREIEVKREERHEEGYDVKVYRPDGKPYSMIDRTFLAEIDKILTPAYYGVDHLEEERFKNLQRCRFFVSIGAVLILVRIKEHRHKEKEWHEEQGEAATVKGYITEGFKISEDVLTVDEELPEVAPEHLELFPRPREESQGFPDVFRPRP